MSFEEISSRSGIGKKAKDKGNGVSQVVGKLVKKGFMWSNNVPNKKGEEIYGGSKTYLKVQMDELLAHVESFYNNPSTIDSAPPTSQPNEPITVKIPTEPISTPVVTPTPQPAVNIPKENKPTLPVQDASKVADDTSHIIFEDFNVTNTLKRYTDDYDLTKKIDDGFTEFRGDTELNDYTLIDLAYYLGNKYPSNDPNYYIFCNLIEDLKRIGKISNENKVL